MGRLTPSALDLGPGLGPMDMLLRRGVLCHHSHLAHLTRANILLLHQLSPAQLRRYHCTITMTVDTMSPNFPPLAKIRGHTPSQLILTNPSYRLVSLW
jgi:hypothetical protein